MFDPDELAGMVDCFGALTADELVRACSETAFRRGEDCEASAARAAIAAALDDYALVEHEDLLVPGPAAFPTLPEGAADLPHILDVEPRSVDREAVARSAVEQFDAALETAVEEADVERCRRLLDRTYELESWGPIDLADERERLDEALSAAEDG